MIKPRTVEALIAASPPGPLNNSSNSALQETAIAKCCRNNCKIEGAGNIQSSTHKLLQIRNPGMFTTIDRMQSRRMSSRSSLTCNHSDALGLHHITTRRRNLDACHLQAYRSFLVTGCSNERRLPQLLAVVWANVRAPDACFVEK
mmetsp:Transcript_90476/g.174155  ORF Transcript_90476/g.174155 Transcript_90476/m.174155 type:complete len:145 (+) Transcript_90476:103-537(+)